ncbi:MAG TPA: metal-dependent hydrolase [Patescibacteria group bacterium]|jgi:inner membrane protein|nr:metal-dependent hydrolase [Patescibacteria group bacterium]
MTGRTHDLAALTTLTVFLTYEPLIRMSLATAVVVGVMCAIGGVTPDLDQPTADLWRKIPAGSVLGHIVSPLLGHHRMISHSLVGMGLAGWGLSFILGYVHKFLLVDMHLVWWAFMFGYASHLVMDTITKEGVPWLFPIPVRMGLPPFKLLRVTTGSFVETLGVFPGLLLVNGYLIYMHYGKFLEFITRYVTR